MSSTDYKSEKLVILDRRKMAATGSVKGGGISLASVMASLSWRLVSDALTDNYQKWNNTGDLDSPLSCTFVIIYISEGTRGAKCYQSRIFHSLLCIPCATRVYPMFRALLSVPDVTIVTRIVHVLPRYSGNSPYSQVTLDFTIVTGEFQVLPEFPENCLSANIAHAYAAWIARHPLCYVSILRYMDSTNTTCVDSSMLEDTSQEMPGQQFPGKGRYSHVMGNTQVHSQDGEKLGQF